jgi:hypothetical protein
MATAKTKPSRKAAKTAARTAKQPSNKPAAKADAKTAAATQPTLRSGLTKVQLTGKPYRVGTQQNGGWWDTVQKQCAAHHGKADVQDLMKANVPGIFVTYCVRRGWLEQAK